MSSAQSVFLPELEIFPRHNTSVVLLLSTVVTSGNEIKNWNRLAHFSIERRNYFAFALVLHFYDLKVAIFLREVKPTQIASVVIRDLSGIELFYEIY